MDVQMDSSPPAALPHAPIPKGAIPDVSIIVPARNEEASLGDCLQSLTAQSGVAFEIIVVDDGSTDRTRAIAHSFAGVQVISTDPLRENSVGKTCTTENWTGKNNAVIAGAKEARAKWLLFTDADTVQQPASLARALTEARVQRADLLCCPAGAGGRPLGRACRDARHLRRTGETVPAA